MKSFKEFNESLIESTVEKKPENVVTHEGAVGRVYINKTGSMCGNYRSKEDAQKAGHESGEARYRKLTAESEEIIEGAVLDAEKALRDHAQRKIDREKTDGPDSAPDAFRHEQIRKQLLVKRQRALSAYRKKFESVELDEGILNKLASKIMGVAPETPKYKVGQHVSYEMNPPQKDGKGSGKIDSYSNGHYMINGKPINHFEIKSVKESKELDEAFAPKEEYKPKAGDSVRIPTNVLGQTIAGKVAREGRTMIHVKTADGETHALPHKHVFKSDLSCKNYHEYSWNHGNSALTSR